MIKGRSITSHLRRCRGWAALALFAAVAAGCSKKAASKDERPPRNVFASKVTTKDVPLYLDEIGTTSPFEMVQIKAQVTGQIMSREFKDGAEVKKGELLFEIDPRPYQAVLEAAKADLALAQANLKRQKVLESKNVTATQDLDTANANAMRAEAAVAAAQVNLDFCSIRSPIDGRAGLRGVDAGNVVNPSSPPLVTVQGLDPIYTDFTISEPDLPMVRKYLDNPNLRVVTDAANDNVQPRTGELYFIDTSVQPGAGTVKARAVTPNPDRALWPEQFVQVRLVLDILKEAHLVPSSAVQIGQNGPYVFVVKDDSTLDLRQVKPGQVHGDLTVISEGVQEGEQVVTSGQLQLSPWRQSGDPGAGAVRRRLPSAIRQDASLIMDPRDPRADREGQHGNGADGVAPAPAAAGKTPGKLMQFSSGLSKPFIQRPVMTMLLTASVIVFGILSYQLLAVNDLPAVDYPVIDVGVSYPGANAETMAATVATPLEKEFTEIPGIVLKHEFERAGADEHHPAIRTRQKHRCGGDGCAIRHPTREWPAPGGFAQPADFLEVEPKRLACFLRGSHEQHPDRWRPLQIRHFAGVAAHQHRARASRRCRSMELNPPFG